MRLTPSPMPRWLFLAEQLRGGQPDRRTDRVDNWGRAQKSVCSSSVATDPQFSRTHKEDFPADADL